MQSLGSGYAGSAQAALDTTTEKAAQGGTAAKVEGSDLQNQSGKDALGTLTDVVLPQASTPLFVCVWWGGGGL